MFRVCNGWFWGFLVKLFLGRFLFFGSYCVFICEMGIWEYRFYGVVVLKKLGRCFFILFGNRRYEEVVFFGS